MSDGNEMGGRFSCAFLVLRSDGGRPEARKAAHHLNDGQPCKKGFQLARRRPHRGREHKPRRPMLAHRADHLLLPNCAFRGVGEKGDIGAALARLLYADRELDIEGVRQVVDDHADDAGLRAPQSRSAPMINVAKLGHCVGDALAGRLRDERASAENERNSRLGYARPAGDIDDCRAPLNNAYLPAGFFVHFAAQLVRSNSIRSRRSTKTSAKYALLS